MTIRKTITTAVSAHAEAAGGTTHTASRDELLELNRKAEHAVSLIMDAAGDDVALTEKILSRLQIAGEDGKLSLVLRGDEIEDPHEFVEHHRSAAAAIASAAKARRSQRHGEWN